MTKQDDLIAYLFEGEQPRAASFKQPEAAPFSAELMQWMAGSSRFTAFVETYRDKIRKKIRVTREAESLLDVRSELAVACRLLNDRRLAVAYEPYASAKQRGPDFAITYRANLIFNIEVARLRVEESGAEGEDLPRAAGGTHKEERLLRVLLYKLGQMQPGMANLLVIQTSEALARSIDLGSLMQAVKIKVEGKDPAFYAASHYTGPADFYKDFLHLSGTLLWGSGVYYWANKQARPALDEKVLRVVAQALSAG